MSKQAVSAHKSRHSSAEQCHQRAEAPRRFLDPRLQSSFQDRRTSQHDGRWVSYGSTVTGTKPPSHPRMPRLKDQPLAWRATGSPEKPLLPCHVPGFAVAHCSACCSSIVSSRRPHSAYAHSDRRDGLVGGLDKPCTMPIMCRWIAECLSDGC